MQLDTLAISQRHYGVDSEHTRKRRRTDSEVYAPRKQQCVDQCQSDEVFAKEKDRGDYAHDLPTQLPSPALTTNDPDLNRLSYGRAIGTKRKAKSFDHLRPLKRTRLLSEPPEQISSIDTWLGRLPRDFEPVGNNENLDVMSQPPSKRSRSSDSLSRRLSQSGDGSETVVSRDKKYSVYKDGNYPVVLETKGSYMGASKAGMREQDKAFCDELFASEQSIPDDVLFDDEHFSAFHANLRGRSEARICADLHPRVMPAVENLTVCGREEFAGLVEGYNDPWIKCLPFYGPRPQPDHTVGFKWSNFNEKQRQKLNIEPIKKSFYTVREDIYFPFLTGEVKYGKQGLDLADRPNAQSMTIALRGIVDVHRRANRLQDIHRRVLGFSISHDDYAARIYAHYPEVDGDNTTFWRETLKELSFGNDKGKERWTCRQFTLNVCQMFAPPLLEQLKSAIDALPNPAAQSFGLTTPFDCISVQGLQDDIGETESQDEGLKKTSSRRGLDVEFKNMIQILQRQLEEQRKDAERQLAQQRGDAERQRVEQQRQNREQMALLEKQMTAQLEQQRKQSEKQVVELTTTLKEQSAQLKELLQKR